MPTTLGPHLGMEAENAVLDSTLVTLVFNLSKSKILLIASDAIWTIRGPSFLSTLLLHDDP